MLIEIQALTAETRFGTPRRAVVGWDSNRLSMLLAVLEARCGLSVNTHDVFLNVAGGLRINEPAADLAVIAALVSSILKIPLPTKVIFFGEIGLSGEVRTVGRSHSRLKEAQKLGFKTAITPIPRKDSGSQETDSILNLNRVKIEHLRELIDFITSFRDNKPEKAVKIEYG